MLIIFRKAKNKKEGKKDGFEQFSTCQNQNDDYICIFGIYKENIN